MKRLALACWLLTLGQFAYAWGDEGHRITGYIANALLSDGTRLQLRALVGSDDLAQIATWMDDEREALNQRLPGSSRWHYENRAACTQSGTAAPACPKGQCITQQIERSTKTLQNRKSPIAQRAESVRILVHLLGDLHQPLHLIDNHDRGGNDVLVYLPREKRSRKLHAVWDTQFVRMNLRRTTEVAYANTLSVRFASERSAWQGGAVNSWANETHALALQHAYYSLPNFACGTSAEPNGMAQTLPTAYIESAKSTVDAQLAKAGMRIASVLNSALKTAPTQPKR